MAAMPLAEQITDLLGARANLIASLLDPGLIPHLEAQAQTVAGRLAATLTSDDERQAADVARDLVILEHGDHDPDPGWWQTPLGRAVAMSIGAECSEAVTLAEAARLLGVSRQRAHALADAGRLDRHPSGGVTRASVMARLAT